MANQPDLSLVIPLYNEEENVENIYTGIKKAFAGKVAYELLFVNNGSRDKTREIIKRIASKDKNVKLVDVKTNIGYGFGVVSGLNAASGKIIGWMDGDDTTDPADVFLLYKKMSDTGSDAGFSERVERGENLFRKLESFFYNTLLFLLYQRNFRDVNSKPKLIKKEHYKTFGLRSKDWFVDTEFCVNAYSKKLRFCRIFRKERPRPHGRSAVKITTALEFLKNILSFRINGRI